MNEFLSVFRNNYANFTGRARRREYWMFSLINALVIFALEIPFLLLALPSMSQDSETSPSALSLVSLLPLVIYYFAALIPALALCIRRLHDTGRSGWLYLLILVPLVGSIIIIVFFATDSQPGSNKWGPNPKGTAAVQGGAWG
ncbi:DUF805 domain-containing protein [Deinococcus aquatilis]|jgi:uncharacterized membrane protein YhaH (DUF805 family)|uniref:DUF805 domain-containing protein n=1 Tax=Deinococcus aquatilis TaxID=519440 RepID=UPI000378450E|nr:DUF805 domain-containing protein [Deinococcus aquatilis]